MNSTDKIALLAIGISIFVGIFSIYTFMKTDEMSTKAFNKNYRPYINAMNFSTTNKDNLLIPSMNVLMIKILNAPAFVISQKLSFYIRESNVDKLLFEHPNYKNQLIYPLDNTQNTIGTDTNIISHSIAEKLLPNIIIRKIRIEYQWISDDTLKYFFEAEWQYNIIKHDWDIIYQKAN